MSSFGDNAHEMAQLQEKIAALSRENGALRAAADPGEEEEVEEETLETSGGQGKSAVAEGGRGGGRAGGGGGRRREKKAETEEGEREEYDGRMVWVKADSTPQTIGRNITGAAMEDARNGFPVYVFSKYDKNSNTAIKGVISAQRVLKEKHHMAIGVYPSFRTNRNELTLKVAPLGLGEQPPHASDPSVLDRCQNLSVAAGTDPKVLAGAIAGQARTGAVLCVRAIGAKAVFEMLRAVGVARAYLDDDGKGQDLVCFPDFVEVNLEGRDEPTNALRLIVTMTVGSPVTVDTSE
mmetsp:Transcript_28673/g.58606  ORF Transcript_28673/g.58606 Transcript_28673/m.58606 type:complete len:293 (-) Transcript_28673:547-1425(-)